MATLAPPKYTMEQPRKSTETEQRHLLADSVAPSESASMIDYGDGERTPRARSPVRLTNEAFERRETIAAPSSGPRPYKGFPSEAHYLAALNEWAESKKFVETGTRVIGFYGHTSMEEYASRPGIEGMGLKKKWKARKERKAEKQSERRNTVA